MENTLLVGNGFSRILVSGMPSWEVLLQDKKTPEPYDPYLNNTLRYEKTVLKQVQSGDGSKNPDSSVKTELAGKLRIQDNYNPDYEGALNQFGEQLYCHNVTNILTTNYEDLIESILAKKCGYTEITPADGTILRKQRQNGDQAQSDGDQGEAGDYIYTAEELYNIRTRKVYSKTYSEGKKHTVTLWKIHGDASRDDGKSIILGFDQYCGQLTKLLEYLKGHYSSDDNTTTQGHPSGLRYAECTTPMLKKIENDTYDGISWAELFFTSNVYIAGFGMDYAEIDLWWLINYRARLKHIKSLNINNQIKIDNHIKYLYHPIYDNPSHNHLVKSRMEAMERFDVECKPINIFCRTKLTKTKIEVDSHTGEDRIVSFENTDPVGYLEGIFALIPERTS